MRYVIPIAIVAIICAAIFIIPKIKTRPSSWRWVRIYWIALAPTLAVMLAQHAWGWPEIFKLAPLWALFYIAGRRDQQGAKTGATTRKSPEPIGHIECYCGEEMPIYGDVEIMGAPGEQTATASVDTSALWLHSFEKHPDAHKEEA